MAHSTGKRSYRVTGLMSGTSLDGVDLAHCHLEHDNGSWSFELLCCETLPYPEELLRLLKLSGTPDRAALEKPDQLLGEYYGKLLLDFHQRNGLDAELIASHGHTLVHEPEKGLTFQAGSGRLMADITGIPVVNDFRSEDVAGGGQGAPLVPLGDRLLFPEFDSCLNLGGIANISLLSENRNVLAYDICVCNMALNHIATLKGLVYDKDGEMARKGKISKELLAGLSSMDYYSMVPPKSLGREWFESFMHPLITDSPLSPEDLMATFLEHISIQISQAIPPETSVLLSGGGALNQYLVERLVSMSTASITVAEREVLEFKEALIFALLGVLRLREEVNVLASVTGGRKDLSAGSIHKP